MLYIGTGVSRHWASTPRIFMGNRKGSRLNDASQAPLPRRRSRTCAPASRFQGPQLVMLLLMLVGRVKSKDCHRRKVSQSRAEKPGGHF